MDSLPQTLKYVKVDADLFESVYYDEINHMLYVKFRDTPAMKFEKVPRFRFQGLMNAPRKDAYYKTFIQNQFLTKPA